MKKAIIMSFLCSIKILIGRKYLCILSSGCLRFQAGIDWNILNCSGIICRMCRDTLRRLQNLSWIFLYNLVDLQWYHSNFVSIFRLQHRIWPSTRPVDTYQDWPYNYLWIFLIKVLQSCKYLWSSSWIIPQTYYFQRYLVFSDSY